MYIDYMLAQTPRSAYIDLLICFGFCVCLACRVIGAVVIVVGLYTVLWGKGKDMVGGGTAAAAKGDEEMNKSGAVDTPVLPLCPAADRHQETGQSPNAA